MRTTPSQTSAIEAILHQHKLYMNHFKPVHIQTTDRKCLYHTLIYPAAGIILLYNL